jgi:hypothetical protein
MAFPGRLSDQQLMAARWDYEATPISERRLATRYGLSRSAIHKWIIKQGWTRATNLRACADQPDQSPVPASAAVGSRKIFQTRTRPRILPATGKLATRSKVATCRRAGGNLVGGIEELPLDRPQSLQNAPLAALAEHETVDQSGQLARPTGADFSPFSSKTNPASGPRAEPAVKQVPLSALRDELALKQVRQLEQHDELLRDYRHVLAVYMNPGRFVDVAGLNAEEAAARLEAASVQAGRLALPGKRDTLAGAIQGLSKAQQASLAAKRTVLGLTPRQIRRGGTQRDEDERKALPDLGALDAPSLRLVTTAMALLRGHALPHAEPPKPPQPDTLDDLVQRRGGVPQDV